MNPLRPVAFHVAALVLGGLTAAFAFSREKNPMQAYETGAVIWQGRPSAVQRVVYENASRRLTLELVGSEHWYLGTVQPLPTGASKPFPAVTTMTKLAEALAPLKASRSFGKIENSRYPELGLDKKDTRLVVVVGGTEHKLLVGAPSPGATDRYVLDESTGNVYAVKADPFQELEAGDNRLAEHDQHDFRELDIASAKIISRDRVRQVVYSESEGKKFWADAADKQKADETVVNFMQKIDRLRATEYAEKQPENAKLVARIEYTGGGKKKGYFELMKSPAKEGDKSDYWMTTEYLHLYGKLIPNMAEQVEQDIDSVVKQ